MGWPDDLWGGATGDTVPATGHEKFRKIEAAKAEVMRVFQEKSDQAWEPVAQGVMEVLAPVVADAVEAALKKVL